MSGHRLAWLTDPAFRQAQEDDPSLLQVRQSIVAIDGRVCDTQKASRLPRVEQVQGLWWRLVTPTAGNGEGQRLVVPEGFRKQLLRAAHDSPWAGHQGPRKTLAWALQFFFWPSI